MGEVIHLPERATRSAPVEADPEAECRRRTALALRRSALEISDILKELKAALSRLRRLVAADED